MTEYYHIVDTDKFSYDLLSKGCCVLIDKGNKMGCCHCHLRFPGSDSDTIIQWFCKGYCEGSTSNSLNHSSVNLCSELVEPVSKRARLCIPLDLMIGPPGLTTPSTPHPWNEKSNHWGNSTGAENNLPVLGKGGFGTLKG